MRKLLYCAVAAATVVSGGALLYKKLSAKTPNNAIAQAAAKQVQPAVDDFDDLIKPAPARTLPAQVALAPVEAIGAAAANDDDDHDATAVFGQTSNAPPPALEPRVEVVARPTQTPEPVGFKIISGQPSDGPKATASAVPAATERDAASAQSADPDSAPALAPPSPPVTAAPVVAAELPPVTAPAPAATVASAATVPADPAAPEVAVAVSPASPAAKSALQPMPIMNLPSAGGVICLAGCVGGAGRVVYVAPPVAQAVSPDGILLVGNKPVEVTNKVVCLAGCGSTPRSYDAAIAQEPVRYVRAGRTMRGVTLAMTGQGSRQESGIMVRRYTRQQLVGGAN